MSLDEYKRDMQGCSRCSSCKWVGFDQIRGARFANNCPSISRFNFHAYSGSGRLNMGLSVLDGRTELNDAAADILFKCQMCNACDTACKVFRDDMEVGEVLLELRAAAVEQGLSPIEHMAMIDWLKKEDNTVGALKEHRGDWAAGLPVKDINTQSAEVLFHAGCQYSYNPELRKIVRGTVKLLLQAGVDVGIAGKTESCSGGRAYEMGYRAEGESFADDMLARVKSSGATTLVAICGDCYGTFTYLYPKMGRPLPCRVVHVSELLAELVRDGKLRLEHEIPLLATYHDPCHLGRMGEPYVGEWEGDKLMRPSRLKRTGKNGVYDQPRAVLTAIPGTKLVEMARIRESSWCCGSGGGALESNPEFADWTARQRIEEAVSTGAEALVTSCPWCVNAFKMAVDDTGSDLEVYELTELVLRSAGLPQDD
jgi:Fe-S oxidoreductase